MPGSPRLTALAAQLIQDSSGRLPGKIFQSARQLSSRRTPSIEVTTCYCCLFAPFAIAIAFAITIAPSLLASAISFAQLKPCCAVACCAVLCRAEATHENKHKGATMTRVDFSQLSPSGACSPQSLAPSHSLSHSHWQWRSLSHSFSLTLFACLSLMLQLARALAFALFLSLLLSVKSFRFCESEFIETILYVIATLCIS